jgi:hypothetical protein
MLMLAQTKTTRLNLKPARARVERARRHSIPQHHNKTKRTPRTHRTARIFLPTTALFPTAWLCRNCSIRPRRIDATRYSPGIGLTSHNHNTLWIFVAYIRNHFSHKRASYKGIAHIRKPWREHKRALQLKEDDQAQAAKADPAMQARADLVSLARKSQKRLEGVVVGKRLVSYACEPAALSQGAN